VAVNEKALMDMARAAMRLAYCPYSKYAVGAALLAGDGRVFTGCNVENASFGLTLCAERVAVMAAVAAGCRDFAALAVTTSGAAFPYPCGACRQVLAEFGAPDMPVYLAGMDAEAAVRQHTLGELLPFAFILNPKP
jgi:cytidine deaminase